MALNLSQSGEKKRISFGAGTMKVGAGGVTPSTDIGYVSSAQLNVTRQKIEVFQGFPRTLIVQYVNQEDVTITVTGIEWSLTNIQRVFAAGTITGNKLGFGGDVNLSTVSLELTHQMPAGGTAVIRAWSAQGQGEVQLSLGDTVHEFPQAFRVLDSATDWAGNSLGSDQRLIQIQLDIPA